MKKKSSARAPARLRCPRAQLRAFLRRTDLVAEKVAGRVDLEELRTLLVIHGAENHDGGSASLRSLLQCGHVHVWRGPAETQM